MFWRLRFFRLIPSSINKCWNPKFKLLRYNFTLSCCQNKPFFLLLCIQSLFIHCAATELTGIFSDIMNLKDRIGFSGSLGVIAAMVEKELGERNFGFDSEVQIETLHGGERDCCRTRDSCQFTSGPCHFSDAPSKWTDSCLYWKHLSPMPPVLVVAGA
jgi:hypothetical protein